MSDERTADLGHILGVSHNPENWRGLTELLTQQGYGVRPVADGKLAIAAVRTEWPDLILLDIAISNPDGYALCKQLKADEKTRDIPVIFISTKAEAIDKVKAFSVGGVDYIIQPFQVPEVWVRIENQLKIQRLQKQLKEQNLQLDREIEERLRAEDRRRASEEKLASAFRSSPDPIAIATWPEGRYLEVNESFCQFSGYSRSEAIARTAWELNAIVDRQEYDRLERKLQAGEVVRDRELQYRTKSGEVKTILISAEIIEIDGQPCILSVSKDISDRKRQENAFRAIAAGTASTTTGREFFRSCVRYLAETLHVRYAIVTKWGNETKTQVRSLAFWNENTWGDNIQYDIADTPCQTVLQSAKTCYYRDRFPDLFPRDRNLIQLNAQSYIGIPLTDSCGNILGHLAVFDRIEIEYNPGIESILKIFAARVGAELERQQGEKALQNSEQHFRALFNSSFQFIGLLQPDGTAIAVNQTALDFTGIQDPDSAIGLPFWELPLWRGSPKTQTNLAAAIARAASGEFIRYEVDAIGSTEEIVTLDLSVKPVFDPSGQVVMLILEGRDISDRITLERELALGQAFLNAFFDSAPVGLMVVDDRLRYVQINEHLARIHGLPVRDHIGKTLTEILPQFAAIVEPLYQQVLVTGQPTIDLEIAAEAPSKPGIERNWVVSYFPITGINDRCIGVGAVVVDISDRKQAELALRDSQRRYQTLAEASPVCIFHTDAHGNCTYINQRWEEITGVSTHNALGLGWVYCLHPQDRQMVVDRWNRAKTLQQPFKCEYRFLHANGTVIWVIGQAVAEMDDRGEIKGYVGTVTDISDRVRAETALRESEERFQLAVSGTKDGIWDLDLRTHQIYFSPVWMEILGYHDGELPHRQTTWSDRVHPDDLNTTLAAFQDHLDGKTSIYEDTYRMKHKDGRWVWIETKAKSVRDASGIPYRVTGTIADITPRKEAEEALQQAVYAADAANRSKSEFLANMSHELRTPLNAILGFAQIMSRDLTLNEQQQENLTIINRSGEHLLELINDILDMSKIEAGRITLNETSFDLFVMLENLEDMLRLKAVSKGLQLIFDRASEVPQYLKTDESKLRQVLINLLGNAIKFTESGSVTLSVAVADDPEIAIANERFTLTFEISDTGPGIAPEELNRIFEPFGQTETGKQSEQGTGLGLPIAQKFVALMGGQLRVSSTPGDGSVFAFDTPVAAGDRAEIPPPVRSRRVLSLAPNQPDYRILVVDDRPESRLLLIRIFTAIGFQVREAENGLEAVALWESWSPHLILMDMRMPVMDGYEATKQIRRHLKGHATIIIALTASAFEEDRKVVLSAGCDDFVRKPFQEAVLLEKVKQYLRVEYLYEPENFFTADGIQPLDAATSADLFCQLDRMSPDWIARVNNAASQGSDDILLELIEEVPPENALLANAITELANNFEFETIMEWTQAEVE